MVYQCTFASPANMPNSRVWLKDSLPNLYTGLRLIRYTVKGIRDMTDTIPLKNLAKKVLQDSVSQLIDLLPRYVAGEQLTGVMDIPLPFLVSEKRVQ